MNNSFGHLVTVEIESTEKLLEFPSFLISVVRQEDYSQYYSQYYSQHKVKMYFVVV